MSFEISLICIFNFVYYLRVFLGRFFKYYILRFFLKVNITTFNALNIKFYKN